MLQGMLKRGDSMAALMRCFTAVLEAPPLPTQLGANVFKNKFIN